MTDLELIQKIKQGCDDSLKELMSRHRPLCEAICEKFYRSFYGLSYNFQDLKDESKYVFYKAVLTYNENKKCKFSSWLGNQINYHCLRNLKKYKSRPPYAEKGDEINEIPFIPKNTTGIDYIMYLLDQFKDPRIKEIFKLRYIDDERVLPLKTVAKQMGISSQTVRKLHSKGKLLLKTKLQSENISDKI